MLFQYRLKKKQTKNENKTKPTKKNPNHQPKKNPKTPTTKKTQPKNNKTPPKNLLMPFQGDDVSMDFLGYVSISDRWVEIHRLACLSMWLPGMTSLHRLGPALPLEWDATPVRCFLSCIRGNGYVLPLEKPIYCGCTHVVGHLINKLAVSVSCHDPDFPFIHKPFLFWLQKLFSSSELDINV